MTPYVAIFSILWFFAFYENILRHKEKGAFLLAIILAFLFTSLRFETGYDWPSYKNIYLTIPSIIDLKFGDIFIYSLNYGKEPVFLVLVSVLKSFFSEPQALIIFVAAVNFYALYVFLVRFTKNRLFVLALVFSWLVFTLYFSVIRQSLAASLFLLFLVSVSKREYLIASLFAILSMAFQVSAILYFLLFFLSRFRIPTFILIFLILLLSMLFIVDISVSRVLVGAVSNLINISGVNEKLEYYVELKRSLSFTEQIVNFISAIFYACFFIWFRVERMQYVTSNKWMELFLNFVLLYCFIQLLFYDLPLFRNRVQYVALPMLYIVFLYAFDSLRGKFLKEFLFAAMFFLNAIYFGLFLAKPSSLPFVPYQSYINYIVTDNEGTGKKRTDETIRNAFK